MARRDTTTDLDGRRGKGSHPAHNQKVHKAELIIMLMKGMTSTQIAAATGATRSTVLTTCDRLELPRPGSPGARELQPEAPPKPKSPIELTGGRYKDLRALSDKTGQPFVKVMRQWHALRLPAQPMRAGQ